MRPRYYLAALAAILLLTTPTTAAAASVELAAADDMSLTASNQPGTLESMQAHGVTRVRFIVYEGRDDTLTASSARAATALGLNTQVVLSAGLGDPPTSRFPQWAAGKAREYAALGVDRFSILNEPDLLLPALDECDTPTEIRQTLRVARTALRPVTVTRRVRRYKTVRRRRHGRVVRVRVALSKRVRVRGHRHGKHRRWRRVPLYRRVQVTRQVSETVYDSTQHVTYTARVGCLRVQRAKQAVRVWRATIPLVRAAAPGAQVLVGETSPVTGVKTFIAEARRLGYPRADGWAHHPYYGHELGLENAKDLDVAEPVYWTEFGTPVRTARDAVPITVARDRWALAVATAGRLGVRELTAYGWNATGLQWDTASQDVTWQRDRSSR